MFGGRCRNCGSEIPRNLNNCPFCGAETSLKKRRIIGTILLIICFIILAKEVGL